MKVLIQPFYDGETSLFPYYHVLGDISYKVNIYNTIKLNTLCKFIILNNKNRKLTRVHESFMLALLLIK